MDEKRGLCVGFEQLFGVFTARVSQFSAAQHPCYFFGALTTSRLRPFARRRLRTLRPALVALRLRNPCSLFRLILLGWYVRFTATAS